MGRRGVSSERRRSSCSSYFSLLLKSVPVASLTGSTAAGEYGP